MPHIMKPCLTKDDHNKNPIGILKLMTEDKTVKPQDVFEGFKPPSKPKKKCVKVCPKGNKVCHCSEKKKVVRVPKKSKKSTY